jgi:hypothetical protein
MGIMIGHDFSSLPFFLFLPLKKKKKSAIFKLLLFEDIMYLVEKIGQLILITLECLVTEEDVISIEKQLKEIIDKEGNEEMVVSISALPPEGEKLSPDLQECLATIVNFCEKNEIRIYSYHY